jgi:hypothetical protein
MPQWITSDGPSFTRLNTNENDPILVKLGATSTSTPLGDLAMVITSLPLNGTLYQVGQNMTKGEKIEAPFALWTQPPLVAQWVSKVIAWRYALAALPFRLIFVEPTTNLLLSFFFFFFLSFFAVHSAKVLIALNPTTL